MHMYICGRFSKTSEPVCFGAFGWIRFGIVTHRCRDLYRQHDRHSQKPAVLIPFTQLRCQSGTAEFDMNQ